jgi:hypothetical protein
VAARIAERGYVGVDYVVPPMPPVARRRTMQATGTYEEDTT